MLSGGVGLAVAGSGRPEGREEPTGGEAAVGVGVSVLPAVVVRSAGVLVL